MSDSSNKDVFEGVLPKVMSTIRTASSLAAQDVNFYKSVDANLSDAIDNSAKNLMDLANRLIQTSADESNTISFGKDNISTDASWNSVANVLDNIFEKIDIGFDQAKTNGASNNGNGLTYLEDSTSNDNSNKHSGKRIVKPQLSFRNKIDNSESHPFKPKITSKPNALVSFEESTKLIAPDQDEGLDEVDPAHYLQPYEYEIDNQPYPESILTKREPIPFNNWHETSAIWVDTIEKLEEIVSELSKSTEIAVDLEHHDYRTYYGLVCLMQISNREQDWIIDTLALRDDLEILNTVFTDPNIVKVFHGAFMDIIWLQRDLGLYIVSLFDTYHASKKLGFPKFSLAYLLETFANFKTSKKYQLADWRIRPLSAPMLAYARSDTHFLLNIYDQLRNKLMDSGNNKLQEVLYESRQVGKRRFEYTKYRPISSNSGKVSCPIMANNPKEPYASIMIQYNIPYHKKPLVEALYNWRDLIAKRDDESVRFVLPNQLLVNLATLTQPVDAQKVLSISNYISDHVRLNAKQLAELIESTLKQMADNDWELVDKWDNASESNKDAFSNVNEETVLLATNAFEVLYTNNADLLQHNTNLLSNDSILFSNVSNNHFSIGYDITKGNVIKHDLVDVHKKRLIYAMKELQNINENHKLNINPEKTIDPDTEKLKEELIPKEEVESKEPILSKEEELDPNEVITLRKKNVKQKQPNPPKDKEHVGSSFDYANSDKILLDTSKKFDSRKDKKKKRSFDPYSKEGGGPQPSKKNRKINAGRTSTFSNSRRA